MPAHPLQPGFVAGELSPQGYGREDFQKYAFGAELIRNAVVRPFGGASRRAGTYFVAEVNDSSKLAVLQPFIFSQTQAYILEMQAGTIRFFRNRAVIRGEGDGVELVTNGDFPSALTGWTSTTTGTGSTAQTGGVARLAQGAAGTARLSQAITIAADEEYIVEFDVIGNPIDAQVGLTDGTANVVAAAQYQVGHHRYHVPVAASTTVWIQFLATGNYNSDLDNVSIQLAEPLVLDGTPASEGPTPPWAESDLRELRFCQINDVLYIFHRDYPTHKLIRLSDVVWELRAVTWSPPPAAEIKEYPQMELTLSATSGTAITLTTDANYWIQGDVGKIVQAGAGRASITAYTSATQVTANVIDTFSSVGPIGRNSWSVLGSPNQTLDPDIKEPVGATATLTAGGNAFRTGTTEVGKYIAIHGGLVRITSITSATVAVGEIVVALTSDAAATAGAWLLQSPQWSASLGYPEAGVRFEGRLVVGRDDTFWGSQTGDFENFAKGTAADTAYEFTTSTEINRMRWMAAARSLLMGTIGNEISARGPTDQSISPESVPKIISEGNAGSDVTCAPVQVGNAMLVVTRSGRKLSELVYSFEEDGVTAHDMTILADHLFVNRSVLQMGRLSEPEQLTLCVGSDGVMLVFAYNRRENIVAWSRFVTGAAQNAVDGQFESVAVIPSMCGTADEAWTSVKRVLDGGTVRYIEVFDGNVQTDSARVYAGVAAGIVDGLDHLEGDTVWVVADGAAAEQAVSGGAVTVDPASTAVEVGLGYTTTIRSLRLSLPTGKGTSQGQKKRINEVITRFLCAGDGWTVEGESTTDKLRPAGEVVQDFRRQMHLGVDREARITVEQARPFGGTVLAMMPSVGVEDG